jgi:hypothetical protein
MKGICADRTSLKPAAKVAKRTHDSDAKPSAVFRCTPGPSTVSLLQLEETTSRQNSQQLEDSGTPDETSVETTPEERQVTNTRIHLERSIGLSASDDDSESLPKERTSLDLQLPSKCFIGLLYT